MRWWVGGVGRVVCWWWGVLVGWCVGGGVCWWDVVSQ